MEDERPSIEDIILAWKMQYGVSRTSERGKTYTEIPRNNREEFFHYLCSTLFEHGYTAKDITRPNICYKLAELCWSEEIYRLSKSIVERKRKQEIDTWKGIVFQSQISFSEKAPTKNTEKELLPVNSKRESAEESVSLEEALKPVNYIQNNPKYSTAHLEPIQVDEDFMAQLNAVKTTLRNKK